MPVTLQYITEYWSQITIVLLAIGYLLKLYFNYRISKSEINHSLFQRMMIDSVAEFFKVYSSNEELWRDLPILRISKGEYSSKELDQMIFTSLNDVKSKTNQLRIFLKDDDMKPFEKIESNVFKINGKVAEIYQKYQLGNKALDLSYDYEETKDFLTKENRILISEIRDLIHRKFK